MKSSGLIKLSFHKLCNIGPSIDRQQWAAVYIDILCKFNVFFVKFPVLRCFLVFMLFMLLGNWVSGDCIAASCKRRWCNQNLFKLLPLEGWQVPTQKVTLISQFKFKWIIRVWYFMPTDIKIKFAMHSGRCALTSLWHYANFEINFSLYQQFQYASTYDACIKHSCSSSKNGSFVAETSPMADNVWINVSFSHKNDRERQKSGALFAGAY